MQVKKRQNVLKKKKGPNRFMFVTKGKTRLLNKREKENVDGRAFEM